jgi:hypothetical protein
MLTQELLMEMIEVLLPVVAEQSAFYAAFLNSIIAMPRFSLLLMFLSDADKTQIATLVNASPASSHEGLRKAFSLK